MLWKRTICAIIFLINRKRKDCFGLFIFGLLFLICFNNLKSNDEVLSACEFERVIPSKSFKNLLKSRKCQCRRWENFVYFNKSGFLHINTTAVSKAKFNLTSFVCEYSVILMDGLNEIRILPRTPFNKPVYIQDEVVHVICNISKTTTVYSNFHFKLNPKINKRKILNESEDQLSIIIVGFDSVSRLLAEIKLPKTLHYIENKLGAYTMKGYTKVGDNTLPNLLAALSGKTLTESILSMRDPPVLYQEALKRGYIDCYAEDWAPYLVPFLVNYPNYTHYLRSMIIAKDHQQLKIFQKRSNGSKVIPLNKNAQCFGNEFKHNIIFQYSKQCIEQYHHKRKYVFMWSNQLAHHSPNDLFLADNDTKHFLEWMNLSGKLKNSVLILMSDHGSGYGALSRHIIGRITSSLPLMSIYIPEHIKQKYPHIHRNLVINSNRLTSHFDLYETLSDIIFQRFIPSRDFASTNVALPRGISLFNEIPIRRTCKDASIMESYCPCYRSENVSTEEDSVKHASSFAVSKINELTSKSNFSCSILQLIKIKSARIQHMPINSITLHERDQWVRYVVVFQTSPGYGIFQSTVDYKIKNKFRLVGDINRINSYGNQSSCVTVDFAHTELRKCCYCIG